MFDPRDVIRDDARQPGGGAPHHNLKPQNPPVVDEVGERSIREMRAVSKARKESQQFYRQRRSRSRGHRREYDPHTTERQTFQHRTDRAIADVGVYRTVAYRDLADAHFEGHPYVARRAVDQMVRAGHVREHNAEGPQGGSYKVLTLTEQGVERAERVAHDHGLDSGQKAWSGLVKPAELRHDVAVFRAARIEHMKLLEQGATIKRIRIDAELKSEVARRSEAARSRAQRSFNFTLSESERAKYGPDATLSGAFKEDAARAGARAAESARREAARDLRLPIHKGAADGWDDVTVLYPDAQLEYTDAEGRSGRVNVEVATEHYTAKSIAAKAAAGFAVHGSNGRASARIARSLGQDEGGGGGGGHDRDKASIEL